ncbi:MAG: isoleucine--tRNA ligase [Patescibacteria group bacterium]
MSKQIANLPAKTDLPAVEAAVLAFWQKEQIFEKSVEQRPADKQYVFYDGPPFATGLPHYGHLLGSTSKDVIPRYWTMKGYRVERVWGWDCHGLPIENMIEQQLDIKGGKKGIEELGIDRFNAACRAEVLRLDGEWEKIIARLGRWVDFENNYKTMDLDYMESVWWGFSQLYEKDLVYQGRKVVLYCPRCATPLSNFEIAMDNSYEDVEDHSVFVKFQLHDQQDTYFLAWTTTPWTLPGNVGLAINVDAEYVKIQDSTTQEYYWLAAERTEAVLSEAPYSVVETVKGAKLVGTKYQPLYEYVQSDATKAWTVQAAEFVSMDDGTGIVHTAALFGEDDYAFAQELGLPLVPTLDDNGHFLPFVKLVAGAFYKQAEKVIVEDLINRNLMLRAEKITHSYPFCYRCQTPLYYNAVPAWFINIQKLKPDLLAQNEPINWYPDHLKYGRFGKGLETAPDWNISRSRYWGTPMPIWEAATSSDDINAQPQRRIIASLDDLQKWAVNPAAAQNITDIHREFLDDIEVWIDDDRTIKGRRIPEVFDCWVESGSMPFASRHVPFENEAVFKQTYPGQFISEYIAQTRAWFYTLHVMSVGIFGKHAADNILTTGTVLAEDGSKMSKSKKNYPDPMSIINEHGADSLRLYLMSSSVMRAENLNFNAKEVADIRKRVFLIWWNCLSFYKLVSNDAPLDLSQPQKPQTTMDAWLLTRLDALTTEVTSAMDKYDVVAASRSLMDFVQDLSTWYLRRSREQLKSGSSKEQSQHILGTTLYQLAQLFAPFTPFFSEFVHHQLIDQKSSIHLTDWPTATQKIDTQLLTGMQHIRDAVEKIHAARSEAGIKIRQPLAQVSVTAPGDQPEQALLDILADEVNVKRVVWQTGEHLSITLDTILTPELRAEGEARELMRSIQKLRKEAGLSFTDKAVVSTPNIPEGWQTQIEAKTNTSLTIGTTLTINQG